MKQTKQIKIMDLNPLKISKEEMEFAREEVMKIYQEDRELFDKAVAIVRQLGLGGLWRGEEASVLIVANAIKEETK